MSEKKDKNVSSLKKEIEKKKVELELLEQQLAFSDEEVVSEDDSLELLAQQEQLEELEKIAAKAPEVSNQVPAAYAIQHEAALAHSYDAVSASYQREHGGVDYNTRDLSLQQTTAQHEKETSSVTQRAGTKASVSKRLEEEQKTKYHR